MLKLKRVELQGFKSFCDRTEMRFHGSGIAAVVGPNGCGKSNLSDAISWVLGEQSAKSLRGARMEDVIFAGTRDRKPLGMASVTLTLVDPKVEAEPAPNGNGNGNGHHPKPDEITITRRLFRSGESEYLINGKAARLRDIQDLFMGTGLGPESYAIIEQGRIGQILSNKPADRRSIIEEAAGVTKFKTRKRLAEAKLEGARQNLTRVFDILEEVARQVNSLKRQASKAKRYEELRGEMVGHLKVLLSGKFKILEREAAKLALDLTRASGEFHQLQSDVAGREQEQTAQRADLYATETALTDARARHAAAQVEIERTRGRLESQAKQIATIEERLQRSESETQELEKRQGEGIVEKEIHVRALVELDEQARTAQERMAGKNSEREAMSVLVRERERNLEMARQSVLRLLGEASTLRNQLAQIEEFLAGVERDTQRSKREEEAAGAELERLAARGAELSDRLSTRRSALEETAALRRETDEQLAGQRGRIAESRKHLEQLRAELSRHRARKDSLEEILSHRAYTTESVKRLFTALERGGAGDFQPAGVLADFIEVLDPAYEKATEEFLHEELEYVVVRNWTDAERGIELMKSDLDGRATFLVHPEPEASSHGPGNVTLEDGVSGKLSHALRFTNGLSGISSAILPRLASCYLVEDREAAQRLAMAHPDLYFLLPDGVSYRGHAVSGGKKTGSGPLALKRELRELSGLVHARQTAVDETTGLLEGYEREAAILEQELERLRALQQSQEKEALALEHENRTLGEETARANSRQTVVARELERLQREDQRARETRERNQALVTEKEAARFEQEKALEELRAELERQQAAMHHLAEEHAVLRAELAGLEERRRSERAAEARLDQQVREISARRETLTREMERLGLERVRLLEDNVALDQRATELAEAIQAAEGEVAGLVEAETARRASLAAIEEALRQLRGEAQAAQERRSQLELDLVRRQADLKYLDETARKELSIAAAELAAGDETVPDEVSLADIEGRYTEVRARIEALGPVNPQALEEFQEAQQRYDFLNAQRQDLLDSIRDTEKAIQDIDVESRRRFGEAFHAINDHFRQMFSTLFGGGIAEMRLTDENNLADSGIDIIASPPGKKLQNVLLLSGGEKSLTAMALLMAIFRYTPSPFCILDEVDAPLDEPNIIRMTRLLKEMSEQTQFVVITHAKRTMESAQALYGVTMQEPGVSKLVSVRFEPAPEQVKLPLETATAMSAN
ncbi:MAG: chromosome segregation protein SMC [Bryobacteraceae bacterium]|nr:chromosome segregation protein SMC [Bryobacteraceae bacterium]